MSCADKQFLALALAFLYVPPLVFGCGGNETAGLFSRCQLTLQDFNFISDAVGGSITSYRLHQVGYAGSPSWIQVSVTPSGDSLFLYGTPLAQDLGLVQLMLTVQRNDFQTSTRNINFMVQPLQGVIAQTSEFFVTNLNLEEVLPDAMYDRLETALREVYPVFEPVILTLIDPRDRNIQVPEPPAKLGVFVQVTPGLNVAMELPAATPEEANLVQGNCRSTELVPPPVNFNQFFIRGFSIDWCQYTVQYLETATSTVSSEVSPVSGLTTPTSGRSSVVLIVIVVVISVIICLAVGILTCVCFGGRRQSLTLPKFRRSRNSHILRLTKSSVHEVSKSQVLLRNLASTHIDRGRATPLEAEPEMREERPQSADTACFEYQDVPDGRDEVSPPPPYCYDERLVTVSISTRSSSPSS